MFDKIKRLSVKIRDYIFAFIRWFVIGVAIGVLCGLTGALFAKGIAYVSGLRGDFPWLVYTLPALGLVSVGVYKLLGVSGVGTNDVFESVRSSKRVRFSLAPAVFLGSLLTHLGGGSAGREGAALQLGGSISSLVARVLRFNDKTRHILTMCGMGALFSSVFGTPVGASVFAIEVVSVGTFCSAALFPCVISSITAYLLSHAMGTQAEAFPLTSVPEVDIASLARVAVIAAACALVSSIFCKLLHQGEHTFKKYLKNDFLRMTVGSALIVVLTVLVGSQEYNGGGIETVMSIFESGSVKYEAFVLKILFTVITVAAGLKGGEIVPTLFIGATLGASVATLIGLSPAFGATVGMAALFCGVTNCPLATMFLCAEMFGGKGMIFIALAVGISFLLSGETSLYSSQKFIYSKLNEDILINQEEQNDVHR